MAKGRSDVKEKRGGERNEVVALVLDYLKQETLEPLKGLGRFVAFGVAGSIALCIGLAIGTVGLLRVLQTETGSTFTGDLSWLPYVICVGALVIVAALAAMSIGRGLAKRRIPASPQTGGKEHTS